jgi:predicted tellurium resistance membrane protein TerC
MLLKVMERLPILVTAGAALLGYLAGEMMAGDAGLARWVGPVTEAAQTMAGAVGAAAVVLTGLALRRRARHDARRP